MSTLSIEPYSRISLLIFTGWLTLLVSQPVNADRNEHRPVCSPDGSSMVYMLQSERTDRDWELYQQVFDTQVQTRLTKHKGWDGYPVWSPDGEQIIFDRQEPPDAPKQPWLMSLDQNTSKPLGHFDGWLSISDWSDDNRLLGFHELDAQRDLVFLDLEGNITEKITDTPGHSEHDASFSPDGLTIAYANGVVSGAETSLELIDLKTRSKTVLHTSIGRIYGISWSPDGKKIAFVDAPGGEDDDADIFLYTLEDKSIQQVTDDPAWDHMPEFCNNNHTLFFTSYRSGEERIYQVDPDPVPFLHVDKTRD